MFSYGRKLGNGGIMPVYMRSPIKILITGTQSQAVASLRITKRPSPALACTAPG